MNTESILTRLRKEREFSVSVGDMVFHMLAPTDEQAALFHQQALNNCRISIECCTGWENVKEKDIFPIDGGDNVVEYSESLKHSWFPQAQRLWSPLGQEALEKFASRSIAAEKALKNSPPG